MSAEFETVEECITFGCKWECSYKDLAGTNFNGSVASPVFLLSHNGIFYEMCVKVTPAGCKSADKEYRKHMGIFRCLYSGLTKSVSVEGLSAAYSTDQNPQLVKMDIGDGFNPMTANGIGDPYVTRLVEQNGKYILPYECNTVAFRYTFRIPVSEFSCSKLLPQPLVHTDDKLRFALYSSTLATPRDPTVDLTLVCEGGVKVHAHKGLLAYASEVFKNLFHSDLNKDAQSDEIRIDTLKAEGIRELVQFAYLGAPSDGIHHNDVVADVLKAAHMYMVEPLIDECERIMVKRVFEDTKKYTIDYYCLADLHKLKILKNVCTAAMLDHWSEMSIFSDARLIDQRAVLVEKLARFSRVHINIFQEEGREDDSDESDSD